jgi:hypothetical protein
MLEASSGCVHKHITTDGQDNTPDKGRDTILSNIPLSSLDLAFPFFHRQ